MTLRVFRFCLAVILLAPMSGCASYEPQYSAKSIEAWVIDADTNEPIEGVIVVANWEILAGEMSARSKIIQLKILESITDKKGRFYFSTWGPEPNPSMIGYMGYGPQILLFKSGYKYRGLVNAVTYTSESGPLRSSDWDGKTITMRKQASDPASLLRDYEQLNYSVESIVRNAPCDWSKVPRLLLAVRKERLLLQEKGVTGGIFSLPAVDQFLVNNAERYSRPGDSGCASPAQFFQSSAP